MTARLSLGTHFAAAERREEARLQEASSRGGNGSLDVHSLEDDYLWGRTAGDGLKRSVARMAGMSSPRNSNAQDVLPEKINPTRKNQSLRKRVRLGLLVSKTNLYLAVVQVIISFLFIVSWVIGTYFEEDMSVRFILFYIDVSFASVLTLYFFFDLFLAEKRGRYLISWSSWIDYVTIIPTFVPPDAKVLESNLGFRFLAGLATFRIFRLYRALKFPISEIKQKILMIGFSVLCIVFVATGLIYEVELEFNEEIKQWQNALYMVVVTVATVGYGDISPVTELGRVLLMLLIVVTFILIPIQTSSLLGLLSQISVYDGSYKPNDAIHVIVTGFVTESKLRQFLNELFSETWVKAAIDLVILGPDKPSPAMKSLIRNAVPEGKRVTYLRGNPLVEEDLIRAAAHKAHAVFVFCNKYANNAEEDKSVILQAIAAKRFSSSLEIFVQIINPESKVQLRREGITNIVCMKELNFSLIGANVLFPGMSTFLNDLISLAKLQQKNYQGRWQEDYTKSKEHGIFRMRLPECFVGKRFDEAAEAIYYEYNAIMFAIRRENDIMELFPYSTMLESTDSVFIILDSYNAADNIAECQAFPAIDIGEVKRLTRDDDEYGDAVKKSTSADWKRALSIVLDRTGENLDKATPRTLVRRKATALLNVAPTTMKAVEMDSLTAPTASDIKVITASTTLTSSGNLDTVSTKKSLLKEPLMDSTGPGPRTRRMSAADLRAEAAAQVQALSKADAFQSAFHLSPAPRNFNQAYRFSVEFEENIERHLIICASTLEGLFYLIGPLRFKRLPKIQQIVILIPELPADYLAHWVQIGIFPEVYVIEGSPMIQLDLKHAGISKADKILILKSGEDKTSATEDSNVVDRFTSDSDAILSYFTVTEQNAIRELLLQKARVTVELGNEESIRFFHEKGHGNKLLSELDTKFTQGKYSLLSAPFGSGRVVLGSTFESLTAKLFFNTDIIIALKLMLSYEKSTPSCVIQIPMPQEFIPKLKKRQRTFKDFFRWAVRKKILLPLGLYRCAGTHGATEGYVHTCPSHHTVLQEQDRFFVVCRKADLNDYLSEMPGIVYDPVQEAANTSKTRKRYNRSDLYSPRTESDSEFNVEEVNMIVNGIKNELSSQAERISNLEEKLSLILDAVTAGKKKDKAEKKEKKISKEQRRNSDKRKSKRSSAKSNHSTAEKSSNVPTPSSSMKNLPQIPEVVVVPPLPKKVLEKRSISIEESSSSSSDEE